MAVAHSPRVVEVEMLAILSSNMESSVMLSGRAPGEKSGVGCSNRPRVAKLVH